MHELGFDVMQLYGLTETYGPGTMCVVQDVWKVPGKFSDQQLAHFKSRQGVRYVTEDVMVGEAVTQRNGEVNIMPVPHDGKTVGEIFFRGNGTMKGYLYNEKATAEAFDGGWFHSGDLAVVQPDGYIKITDRSKDIIISGGENISSIEVQNTIRRHHLVADSAVVAMVLVVDLLCIMLAGGECSFTELCYFIQ